MQTMGDLVREARLRHHPNGRATPLTQEEAGAKTRWSQRAVSDFESGRRTEHAFDYAVCLAGAINDMELLRRAIEMRTGLPVAGRPAPADLVRQPASLAQLANRREEIRRRALAEIEFWRRLPDQVGAAKQAALAILDDKEANEWIFDSICSEAGLDPDELLREHGRQREVVAV